MSAILTPQLLVVDADQTFSRTLCRLLSENGYEASGLPSSLTLDEYLATRPVDLLLLDLSMPGAAGKSMLESIRKDYDASVRVEHLNLEDIFLEMHQS